MQFKTTTLSSAALTVIAGTILAAATAVAQTQSPGESAPAMQSQPATAQPGSEMQPMQQSSPNASDQQQPGSMQSSAPATTGTSAGVALSTVKNAKTTLASASVQDASGQPIGQVSTVHTSKRGTPTTIDVTLQSVGGSQPKTVAIRANQLHYDQSSNTLKTDLTATEVQSLPTASGT